MASRFRLFCAVEGGDLCVRQRPQKHAERTPRGDPGVGCSPALDDLVSHSVQCNRSVKPADLILPLTHIVFALIVSCSAIALERNPASLAGRTCSAASYHVKLRPCSHSDVLLRATGSGQHRAGIAVGMCATAHGLKMACAKVTAICPRKSQEMKIRSGCSCTVPARHLVGLSAVRRVMQMRRNEEDMGGRYHTWAASCPNCCVRRELETPRDCASGTPIPKSSCWVMLESPT